MYNFALKFQAVGEKTAKDARGLLYFAAPGRAIVHSVSQLQSRVLNPFPGGASLDFLRFVGKKTCAKGKGKS